jgi:hypothetical protein
MSGVICFMGDLLSNPLQEQAPDQPVSVTPLGFAELCHLLPQSGLRGPARAIAIHRRGDAATRRRQDLSHLWHTICRTVDGVTGPM